MNFQKINDLLNKGMIGLFISIFPLFFLTMLLPIFGYLIAIILILLMVVTGANFITTTILFVLQINILIDNFFKYYEQ